MRAEKKRDGERENAENAYLYANAWPVHCKHVLLLCAFAYCGGI